jgi:selenocysteine lyase/cysteine desulfurase
VGVKDMESAEMAKTLLDKHKTWTVAINTGGVNGCRISPNVFTTTEELDVLLKTLRSMG